MTGESASNGNSIERQCKMGDLTRRAMKRAKSRQPVREAVGKRRDEIYEARRAGVSWAVLHAQLESEGVYVGRGPSSLISAMKYWAEQDRVSLPSSSNEASAQNPDPSARDFSDTRFATDWGQP